MTVTIGDTPPPSPVASDQWWDSVGGQLYIYFNDGTSSQWVPATNQPGAPGPRGPQGPQGPPGPRRAGGSGGSGGSGNGGGSRTVGGLLTEARQLLNDTIPISGSSRFADSDLVNALNEAVLQIRAKRPDAFLSYGLRNPAPVYVMPTDVDKTFPFEDMFYSPLLFYVVGRSELTEDTFSDDGRAVTLMTKFTSQLLRVQS